MASKLPVGLLRYAKAANDYLRSLPLEHFMESTPQATQREITLASFSLLKARRSDVHLFNELLVQFPIRGRRQPAQVVPDNMVVVWDGPIDAVGSYDVPFQPDRPFWVFEYVSPSNKRKDYEDSFDKYERLKVPYYLVFYPESQDLTLFHHQGEKYVSKRPNRRGRLAIPELDMEVALLDGWVRYWYQGKLLPLPADLQRDLDEARRQLAAEKQGRLAAEQEVARLRTEIERLRSRRNGGAT
ncbi:MAG TPA: Uma2 family endonuclease [Gemmataceae bacterium]|nr:Uma2 family endonuclease [Gemmataceae bacterium]